MNAGEYAGTVFVTALGGFDPAPMIIMAAALGAGVRRRHIMGASALLLLSLIHISEPTRLYPKSRMPSSA